MAHEASEAFSLFGPISPGEYQALTTLAGDEVAIINAIRRFSSRGEELDYAVIVEEDVFGYGTTVAYTRLDPKRIGEIIAGEGIVENGLPALVDARIVMSRQHRERLEAAAELGQGARLQEFSPQPIDEA